MENSNLIFVERSQVKNGVVCDVYQYKDDNSKDLGIVTVSKGFQTPKQEVLKGERTLEIFISGKGSLQVTRANNTETHTYPGGPNEVEVQIGDIMQWTADEDLVFHEICYPPYEDGRFKNL